MRETARRCGFDVGRTSRGPPTAPRKSGRLASGADACGRGGEEEVSERYEGGGWAKVVAV